MSCHRLATSAITCSVPCCMLYTNDKTSHSTAQPLTLLPLYGRQASVHAAPSPCRHVTTAVPCSSWLWCLTLSPTRAAACVLRHVPSLRRTQNPDTDKSWKLSPMLNVSTCSLSHGLLRGCPIVHHIMCPCTAQVHHILAKADACTAHGHWVNWDTLPNNTLRPVGT